MGKKEKENRISEIFLWTRVHRILLSLIVLILLFGCTFFALDDVFHLEQQAVETVSAFLNQHQKPIYAILLVLIGADTFVLYIRRGTKVDDMEFELAQFKEEYEREVAAIKKDLGQLQGSSQSLDKDMVALEKDIKQEFKSQAKDKINEYRNEIDKSVIRLQGLNDNFAHVTIKSNKKIYGIYRKAVKDLEPKIEKVTDNILDHNKER